MGQVDESYPPEDNRQSGAHLTIKFTGDLDSQVTEMQGVRCRVLGYKQETLVMALLGPWFLCL